MSTLAVVPLLLLGTLALAQTKPPSPVLTGKPIPTDTVLTLQISDPGPGANVVIRLYRNGTEDTAIRVSPRVSAGKVEVTLVNALKAKEELTLTQTIAGVESTPSAPYPVPLIAPPTVQILSAQAFFAHNVVPLTFKAANADSVTFDICTENPCKTKLGTLKADADDLKKGKADLTLHRPLNILKDIHLTYTATRNGADKLDGSRVVQVEGLNFRLDGPPTEGQKELKGKAASFVKGMVVYVYGGAYADSRIPPDLNTSDATKTNQQKADDKYADLTQRFLRKTGLEAFEPSVATLEEAIRKDFAANDLRDELYRDNASVEKGSFTFTLKQPLNAGQRLVICASVDNDPGLSKHYCEPQNYIVRSVAIDFGRMRAYFSAGTVISSGNNSFGKADPYLAFNSDIAFWNNLLTKKEKKDGCVDGNCFRNQKFGISIHGFIDVRLTQAATDSKSTVTAATALLTGPIAQQAGVFQAGFYVPMRVKGMDWVYDGSQYSAYFAPVGKFGVNHLKDGVILSESSVTATTKVEDLLRPELAPKVTSETKPTPTSTTKPLPLYGYGLRLGVMKYDLMGRTLSNRQIAPDNLGYFEVTYGQNGIYRRAVTNPATNGEPEVTLNNQTRTTVNTLTRRTIHTIEPGFNIEGRLKLPHIPAQVGFDVFFHRRRPDQSANADFRFILGFRVDVAKALGRAFGVTP